jgi:tetratricopeptide repeat protein
VKRKNTSVLVIISWLLLAPAGVGAQSSAPDEVSSRLTRFEAWLKAIEQHRPGALDDSVRLVNLWNQEQLRLIWIDVSTVVSLVREPSVTLFFVSEPAGPARQGRLVGPPRATAPRPTQVLYTIGELRRLRELAKRISPTSTPGPENNILKRGALLHADVAILEPSGAGSADPFRPGPGGTLLLMEDGQQTGLLGRVSHWDMGRRLLDRVRPPESRRSLTTMPDPASDDGVRRWYVASGAYMTRIRRVEPSHFARALELFPNDPEVLFLAASAHESFAGVRTQSVMRSMKVPRDVTFDIQDEGAELRRAEQLYKRALERNPSMVEARIRLGRVLGRRGRHDEAVKQLLQGKSATEPLLQYYAHLFLGAEFEALGNGAEARQSYERAAVLAPTAQSPLLGLSRLADQAGDRAAARDFIARVLKLPVNEPERADPLWVYEVVQARAVDGLLADLRQRIAALPK